MKVGLIVPPFIPVPPERYGGTELFVAHLAEGLQAHGCEVVVYTVGASTVRSPTRWRSERGQWPIESVLESSLDDLEHSSWACEEASRACDVIHLNNAPGLNYSRFVARPFVYTLHHPHEAALSAFYAHFPDINYVAISRKQASKETMSKLRVIHHGLDLKRYQVASGRRDHLCFIGRIAPIKGVHRAIAVARKSGVPLKIAGEIQPAYRDYWEQQIKPALGHGVEYVGEVDLTAKNALLAGARALLFPIEWDEPFGLVMIEAMACGVPVLAFGSGSVPEVVVNGVSGWICRDLDEMATQARDLDLDAATCRNYVRERFSLNAMVAKYLAVYQDALHPTAEPATLLREAS